MGSGGGALKQTRAIRILESTPWWADAQNLRRRRGIPRVRRARWPPSRDPCLPPRPVTAPNGASLPACRAPSLPVRTWLCSKLALAPARHCLAVLGQAGDPDTLPHTPPAHQVSTSHRDLCQPPTLPVPFPEQASARAQTATRTTARTPARPRSPRRLSISRIRTARSAPRARRTASPRRGRLRCTP